VRVLVTTQHRVARADATHGHLLELDWERGRVVRRIEAPPLWSHFGRRDRGGRRGLRGITFFRGLIWVASCDVVYGLDPRSLEPERCVSHRYMAHIHEIEATDEGIWVTSTGGNGIFLIDETQTVLKEAWLGEAPREDLRFHLEQWRDEQHLNTVYLEDGAAYAYALRSGRVFRMYPGPVTPVLQIEKGCHNVVKTAYGWFRNVSKESVVRIGEREVRVPRRGRAGRFTQPGWLRGMAWLSKNRVLVGASPATLFEIDVDEMRVVREVRLERDVCWTVHGIYVDTHEPSPPPRRPMADRLASARLVPRRWWTRGER